MERTVICVVLMAFQLGVIMRPVAGAPLAGTEALNAQGDLSAQMVAGISNFLDEETTRVAEERAKYWKRDFSSPAGYLNSIAPNRARLRQIIGADDRRVAFSDLEFTTTTVRDRKVAESERYEVFTVRWPVYPGVNGEGLWLRQKQKSAGTVICLPDADQTPELVCG